MTLARTVIVARLPSFNLELRRLSFWKGSFLVKTIGTPPGPTMGEYCRESFASFDLGCVFFEGTEGTLFKL